MSVLLTLVCALQVAEMQFRDQRKPEGAQKGPDAVGRGRTPLSVRVEKLTKITGWNTYLGDPR